MNTTTRKNMPLREQGQEVQHQQSANDSTVSIAFVKHVRAEVDAAGSVQWGMICKLLADCGIGKKDGDAWLPVDMDKGPRKAERVRSVSALVLDVEEVSKGKGLQPPHVDDMLAELRRFGHLAILHTSYSHAPESPRYRIVFALSRSIRGDEIRPLGLHVATLLGLSGCLDTKCLEPARLFFLPRVQDEARKAHFLHADIPGDPLPVDDLLADAQSIGRAVQGGKQERKERQQADPNGCSIIAAFNDAHDISAILENSGYHPQGRNRWISPTSTSEMAGIHLLPDTDPPMIYSHHGEHDPLTDGRAHDAFDCWRILNHDCDMTAAVREAAGLLGMDGDSRPQEAPQRDLSPPAGVGQPEPIDKRRDPPWFKVFASDRMADADYRCLSFAERGLLDSLRLEIWVARGKGVPNDLVKIARLLNCDAKEVEALLPGVLPMLCVTDDRIHDADLTRQYAELMDQRRREIEGGKRGGQTTQRNRRQAPL